MHAHRATKESWRYGAGVLLLAPSDDGVPSMFIVRRRRGRCFGAWSVPFGQWSAGDGPDLLNTALREFREECGSHPMVDDALSAACQQRPSHLSRLWVPGLIDLRTYALWVSTIPEAFPNPSRLASEATEHRWVTADAVPDDRHVGLRLALRRLPTLIPAQAG